MDTQTLIGLLGLLEAFFIVAAVAVVSIFKLRSARRESADLRKQLSEAAVVSVRTATPTVVAVAQPDAPVAEYADFLREQLDRSSLLLGEDVQTDAAQVFAQADVETHNRQMLAARHQFLQLELDQQNGIHDDDPQQQRQHLVAGMQALLDAMGWQQSAGEADASAATGAEQNAEAQLTVRSEVIKLGEQITSLRRVIDNQHDSMRELRRLLEEQGDGSDELKAALKKLGSAEAQAVELYRCMEVVEGENERLKHAPAKTGSAGGAASEDADMLRDLVSNQQRTIGTLQELLRGIAPDGERDSKLDAAIDKIQRTNNELNACVMLLEDENNMLRTRAEDLQARLDQQEADAIAAIESQPAPVSGSAAADAPDELEVDAEIDIDALLESGAAVQPLTVADEIIEAGSEAEPISPPAVDDEADFDIDSLLESAAVSVKSEPAAVSEIIEAEPISPPAADDEADFDIDSLLESAATATSPPVADETAPIMDDIDALIGQFGRDAAPTTLKQVEKTMPAKDETDALLAELFGSSSKDSR